MKKSQNDICQSCGMPMTKTDDFGTNQDGSSHSSYCHFCYMDGKFADAVITLAEKITKNIAIAIKMGMPEKEAIAMANSTLPKLKRWLNSK